MQRYTKGDIHGWRYIKRGINKKKHIKGYIEHKGRYIRRRTYMQEYIEEDIYGWG